mgnify:CR=1 FL=1
MSEETITTCYGKQVVRLSVCLYADAWTLRAVW